MCVCLSLFTMAPPATQAATDTAEASKQKDVAGNSHTEFNPEEHERPLTPLSESSQEKATPSRQSVSRQVSNASRRLTRTVSEVRDGIQNQRDLELGRDSHDEKETADAASRDPNIVTWDGPDDPANPKNWLIRVRWTAVICVSFFTFISPLASSMVAPALADIGRDLNIHGETELALVLSIFVCAYAVGPLVWGPMSELYGRVLVIQVSNFWFLCFNLGCGLAKTEGQMIAFRFLAGLGGSAPLAVGGGVLSDMFTAEQRGKAISVYSLTPLLGPALGPVAGGWVAEKTTWRWVFYATTIACGVIQVFGIFFLSESYAPVLLHRKKMALIKETGNTNLRTEYDRPDRTLIQTLTKAFTRPFKLLATQFIVQIMALYMMYLYGMMYLLLSTFSTLFSRVYGEGPGIQGLNYISIGLGCFLGAQICAPLQDRIYAALKKRYVPEGGPGKPEFRIPMMVPGAILVPIGLLIYSWTAEYHTHWIWPDIGICIFAAGTIIGFQCIQGYLVDSYTAYAASAVGAATVLRSLAGFGFPLFAPAMYKALGYGKGGTVLAAFAIVIGWPAPFLLWKYGERLRKQKHNF